METEVADQKTKKLFPGKGRHPCHFYNIHVHNKLQKKKRQKLSKKNSLKIIFKYPIRCFQFNQMYTIN